MDAPLTVDMTYADGQPMSVLMSLIKRRQKILGETPRNAMVATAITALKSLRAATRKGKSKVKVKRK